MKTPHPLIIDDLYVEFRATHTRADLIACWQNAHKAWGLLPEYLGNNEPAEVTAARALFVRARVTTNDAKYQQEIYAGMWALVSPYTKHAAA